MRTKTVAEHTTFEIFQQSFEILKKQFSPLMVFALGAALFNFLFSEILWAGSETSDMPYDFLMITPKEYILEFIMVFVSFLVGIFAAIGIILITKKSLEGKSFDMTELLGLIRSRWVFVVFTAAIAMILNGLLFLLLIIPGIIYGVYWAFALQIATLKGVYKKDALDYSKELIRGKWWDTALRLLLIFLLFGLIASVSGSLFAFLLKLIGLEGTILSQTIALFVSAFGMLYNIPMTIFFLNREAVVAGRVK